MRLCDRIITRPAMMMYGHFSGMNPEVGVSLKEWSTWLGDHNYCSLSWSDSHPATIYNDYWSHWGSDGDGNITFGDGATRWHMRRLR